MDVHRENPVRCEDIILVNHTLQHFGSLTLEELEDSLPDKKGRGEIKFLAIFLYKVQQN